MKQLALSIILLVTVPRLAHADEKSDQAAIATAKKWLTTMLKGGGVAPVSKKAPLFYATDTAMPECKRVKSGKVTDGFALVGVLDCLRAAYNDLSTPPPEAHLWETTSVEILSGTVFPKKVLKKIAAGLKGTTIIEAVFRGDVSGIDFYVAVDPNGAVRAVMFNETGG